jgi:hypothetical protein
MAEVEFLDIKIGDGLTLNGYPMGLLAVGNLLVADHQRVEIVILQKLEEAPDTAETPTPRQFLVQRLEASGFTNGVLQDILNAAIGRRLRDISELTDEEVLVSIGAVESAIADDEQENSDN